MKVRYKIPPLSNQVTTHHLEEGKTNKQNPIAFITQNRGSFFILFFKTMILFYTLCELYV